MKIMSQKLLQFVTIISLLALTSFSFPTNIQREIKKQHSTTCDGWLDLQSVTYIGGNKARLSVILHTSAGYIHPDLWYISPNAENVVEQGYSVQFTIDTAEICSQQGTCPYATVSVAAYYECEGQSYSTGADFVVLVP